MELPSLVGKVLEKAAPISQTENKSIIDGCRLWYEGIVKKTADKVLANEPLTLVDKLVLQMDSWYFRLALTLSYFFIISFIQGILDPAKNNHDDDYDEEK
jgi:hypothetical protein